MPALLSSPSALNTARRSAPCYPLRTASVAGIATSALLFACAATNSPAGLLDPSVWAGFLAVSLAFAGLALVRTCRGHS